MRSEQRAALLTRAIPKSQVQHGTTLMRRLHRHLAIGHDGMMLLFEIFKDNSSGLTFACYSEVPGWGND